MNKICENCPNKSLCKLGIVVGTIGLVSSSFIIAKKLYKKLTKKKTFPGPNLKDNNDVNMDVNI
jgi:hypothetical protein